MNTARISIVTISLNQGAFLAEAIESVLTQDYDEVEYIVVDPGSTDGSRDIIRRYGDRITHVVFEPDAGPAEGLNKGFRQATGDIYGFLNADDVLLPGALRTVASAAQATGADVLSGHCLMIDAQGRVLRRSYSDPFSVRALANGGCLLMQPSTFFRATAFAAVGGFNPANRVNWDSELWVDMAMSGARFAVLPALLSGYRLYPGTLTVSSGALQRHREHQREVFERVMGRPPRPLNLLTRLCYRTRKYVLNPASLLERLRHGPVLGRDLSIRAGTPATTE